MKPKKADLKTVKHGYLYSDGHMVLVHEKRDRDAGFVNWVTIYQNIDVTCQINEGRFIIDKSVLPFALQATSIQAKPASRESGSENTKRMGIAVQNIILRNGLGSWIIPQFPDLISSDIKYQPETSESFEDLKDQYYWSDYRIKKVFAN